MDQKPEMTNETVEEAVSEAAAEPVEEAAAEEAAETVEEAAAEAASDTAVFTVSETVQTETAAKKPLKGRKLWKKKARKNVKTHYFLIVVACLIAVFFGTEFSFVKNDAEDGYAFITGKDVSIGSNHLKYNSISEGNEGGLDLIVNLLSQGENTDKETNTRQKVFQDILNLESDEGAQKADEQMEKYENEKISDKITGRSSGIFAGLANKISSGQIYITIFDGITSVTKSKNAASAIFVILITLGVIFIWIFIRNVYVGILRRVILEARVYEQVPIAHFIHFKLVHRWIRAALSLLLVDVLEVLWWFTIVGGMIKHYSYFLTPYIVAENPDIKPKEAKNLSRRMMDGYKWTAFKMELSFIGWRILGMITFGILDALWVVPYSQATYAEFYASRRYFAKKKGVQGTEALNDEYLFTKAEEGFLRKTYADVEEHKKYIDENRVTLPKVRGFIVKNFGIWVGSNAEKIQYDAVDSVRQQIVVDRAVIKGKIYPSRLSPLWDEKNNNVVGSVRALRTYTIWTIVLVFFVFSFIGWAYEVSIHLIEDGVFVNRGCMHGPWLPIYGGGVSMIVILLTRWRNRPHMHAVLTVILCGLVEYYTSYFLEVTKGMRWWDYTGYFLNLNGRICGEGLLVFLIGGMASVYFLVPIFDTLINKINYKILATSSIILLVIFIADVVYSHYVPNVGDGITDYSAYEEAAVPQHLLDYDGGGGSHMMQWDWQSHMKC